MKIQRHSPMTCHSISPMAGILAAVLMLSTFTLGACGDPPPPPQLSEFEFSIEAFVYDQHDAPVARVPVLIDGQIVGYSDKDGAFTARILEAPNTQIELRFGEIVGYRFTSDNVLRETLVIKQGIGGNPVGLPLTLRSSVHSLKNSYLAWIQLNCDESLQEGSCENIPLKLDGKLIATTDANGKAHFAFDGIVGKKSLVTVDTPVYQKNSDYYVVFEPKQPSFELNLGLDNTVFVIEESFTDLIGQHADRTAEKTKPKATVRKAAPAARPSGTKTSSARAPAAKAPAAKKPVAKEVPKKPEPKNSVIDLW